MVDLSEIFEREKKRELEKEAEDSKLIIIHDEHGRLLFEQKLDSCF